MGLTDKVHSVKVINKAECQRLVGGERVVYRDTRLGLYVYKGFVSIIICNVKSSMDAKLPGSRCDFTI
jgi:hypothetical protein